MTQQTLQVLASEQVVIGNRVPKDFFVTSGTGESNITVHAGSYHLALRAAGIERCNIMVYSSILPAIAQRVEKNTDDLVHGSVMETIMACANSRKGKRATAAIVYGWLYNRRTGERYGGLVCEYNGSDPEERAIASLRASLDELYKNGYSEEFELKDIEAVSKSFVPKKKFGTALVALCFKNYVYPVVS